MALTMPWYGCPHPWGQAAPTPRLKSHSHISHFQGGSGGFGMLLWGPHLHPGILSSLVSPPMAWEGAGAPCLFLGYASHGYPRLSSPAGACPSELVKCLPGSVPPRATLTCNKTGKKDSCALTCTSKARFLPGTGTGVTASMGRGVPSSLPGPSFGGRSVCMARVQRPKQEPRK